MPDSNRGPVPKDSTVAGCWYRAKQDESLYSIAHKVGHSADKIWQHSANKNLRDRRGKPNILLPGDWIYIPPIERYSEIVATDSKHSFRCKKTHLNTLKIRIVPFRSAVHSASPEDGDPIAYSLWIGKKQVTGSARPGDIIEVQNIPANIKSAALTMLGRTIKLKIGQLDPIDEPSGIDQRLHSLGYGYGEKAREIFKKLNDLQDDASEQDIQNKLSELQTGSGNGAK